MFSRKIIIDMAVNVMNVENAHILVLAGLARTW